MTNNKAIFAAGCFWGVEQTFTKLTGILSTKVGYTGGNKENPTYKEVCTGYTGHAESVLINFDTNLISYNSLLNIFWKCHDPTTLNQQGLDIGSQYRSAIFYLTEDQRIIANKSKENISQKYKDKIVTEIIQANKFYLAEEYHQKYLQKNKL